MKSPDQKIFFFMYKQIGTDKKVRSDHVSGERKKTTNQLQAKVNFMLKCMEMY